MLTKRHFRERSKTMNTKTIALTIFMLLTFVTASSNIFAEREKGETTMIEGFSEASLTIFPVTYAITGPVDKSPEYRAFADAAKREFPKAGRENADTLGLLLEEKGYDKFEVTDTAFRFPEGKAARKERAAAFGKFVRELGLRSDYALCTEFTLHLEESWQEVYTVIVDAKGAVVWEESLQPDDSDFYRALDPGEVEQACGWICDRLAPLMGLDQLPNKEPSEETKEARRKKQAEAGPNPSERAAMKERLAVLEKTATSARVTVYPTRVGGDHTDSDSASRLAEFINGAKLCNASVAETGPVLKGKGWPNEAKVLWIFANAARDFARENPTDSDYVLFADYWLNPRGEVWAVHFVVCDRAGDWVIVDLQNNHHEDFQRVDPKTLADCDRLVFERLKEYLALSRIVKHDIVLNLSATVSMDKFVAGSYISGNVEGLQPEETATHKVLVYVLTDQWYIHPFAENKARLGYATIQADGSWEIQTEARNHKPSRIAIAVVPRGALRPLTIPPDGDADGALKAKLAKNLKALLITNAPEGL
jgi:hypothetical protein